MRIMPIVLLALASLAVPASVLSQAPADQVVIRQDGGANGRMESVFFPPKPGAPFSLTLATEWTRPLGNGGTFTLVNRRRVVRDQEGRIYQERWVLVPKDGKIKSRMDIFQITDPHQHTWYNCDVAHKICDLYRYSLTTGQQYPPAIGSSGPLPNGNGFRSHEDLGTSTTQGLETHGYRESTTINPGVLGNDKPMVTTREFWYSPQLAFNLLSTVVTPQSGKQVFTAEDLSTSEPDATFFDVPVDYKIVDRTQE